MTTACELAEAEGWPAVTTRRLSGIIGSSQPVLYGHFPTMRAIMPATAIEGSVELGVDLRRPRRGASDVGRVARAHLDLAAAQPALYEAMFTSAPPSTAWRPSTPRADCGPRNTRPGYGRPRTVTDGRGVRRRTPLLRSRDPEVVPHLERRG
ncbi:hypothetical protein [Lapillicoccus sp.]|uniref:TetR/AcrR family transcriptional regulator n=1 Tax=Lapillicoccus sp. TaxID=1909287 RepID=UPI0034504B43